MTGYSMKADTEQAERLHSFAHDLRNRLAAIQQVLSQLKEGPADPDKAQLIEFAEQQYFKAMRSSEELLDAFGVERGVGTLSIERLDLSSVLTDSLKALQHRFERKQQHVSVETVAGADVAGDPHWLVQLVSALISNASKFTPVGGRIRVGVRQVNGQVELTVTDHGVGLDTEDLQNVLTRYAWLKSKSTSGEAQGRSTLGRAAQWAQAHGGSLTAFSAGTGHGATFVLRLPAAP